MQHNVIEYEAVDRAELESSVRSLVQSATAITIDSDDMHEIAADELREIKTRLKAVEEKRQEVRRPITEALKKLDELFAAPIEHLKGAERTVKQAIAAWLDEKERIAAEARRKAEQAEREARQKAEAEARAMREQAEAEARKAKEAADYETMRKANEAAAELTARAAAHAAQAAATVMTAPVVAPAATEGVHGRFTYSAECFDPMALAAFVVENPSYANLITVNKAALNQTARAQKEGFTLPGCKLLRTRSIAARGK